MTLPAKEAENSGSPESIAEASAPAPGASSKVGAKVGANGPAKTAVSAPSKTSVAASPVVRFSSRDEVAATITALISSEFNLPLENVLPEKRLTDDLGLDSIDLCDALVRLEDQTGGSYPLEHFAGVITVDDFVRVAAKIALEER